VNREFEELSFGSSPECSRHPGIEKPHDCLQDMIRGKTVSAVDPEHPPIQAQHHCLIGMGHHTLDIFQAERHQPLRQTVLKQKTLIRVPAYRLTGRLPPLHSPWSPPATDTATFGAPFRPKENLSEGMNCRSAETQRKCWICTD